MQAWLRPLRFTEKMDTDEIINVCLSVCVWTAAGHYVKTIRPPQVWESTEASPDSSYD